MSLLALEIPTSLEKHVSGLASGRFEACAAALSIRCRGQPGRETFRMRLPFGKSACLESIAELDGKESMGGARRRLSGIHMGSSWYALYLVVSALLDTCHPTSCLPPPAFFDRLRSSALCVLARVVQCVGGKQETRGKGVWEVDTRAADKRGCGVTRLTS